MSDSSQPAHPAQAATSSQQRVFVPPRLLNTEHEVIDTDPHIKRVFGYARPSDYAKGAVAATIPPGLFWAMEHWHPSYVGKGGFAPIMRLTVAMGLTFGTVWVYTRSCMRFYGKYENKREVDMDMREMVDKVKRGEPLYGVSSLSPYMQGVAARNSRYSAFMADLILWPNFVNHNQHGVDTAKYYQQAERELEAERTKRLK